MIIKNCNILRHDLKMIKTSFFPLPNGEKNNNKTDLSFRQNCQHSRCYNSNAIVYQTGTAYIQSERKSGLIHRRCFFSSSIVDDVAFNQLVSLLFGGRSWWEQIISK